MNRSFLSHWRKSALLLLFVAAAVVFIVRSRPDQRRTTQPRLSGYDDWHPCAVSVPAGHVMEIAECAPPNRNAALVSLAVSECDDHMNTAQDAVRVLSVAEQCTDAVIEKLETLAERRADETLLSDLAAAYYVRAQRKDQPSDLVRSLAAADRAVHLAPTSAQARFNRALAQEQLGLADQAMQSWDALRKESYSPWTDEAQVHYERLVSARSRAAATQWQLHKARLPVAARLGDRAAIRQLVDPYRNAAQRYVEEEVLPAWATASMAGRFEEAAGQLALAETIASTLAGLTHDRYLLDGVQAIRSSRNPQELDSLRRGQLALVAGRRSTRSMTGAAERAFADAEAAFAAAGGPFRLGAVLGRATMLTLKGRLDEALVLFKVVERDAGARGYGNVLARVSAGRGYLLMVQSRHIDSLAEYANAKALFDQIGDTENAGSTENIRVGLFRQIGHEEQTWRALLQAQRHADALVDIRARHINVGEKALSAAELGLPSVALQFQDVAVRLCEDELSRNSDETAVRALQVNLGVALRTRACLRLSIDDAQGAESDLARAVPLIGEQGELIQTGFRALLAELRAQNLAQKDPKAAIGELDRAISLVKATHYQSMRSSLCLQRATLHARDGNRPAAAADLREAIALLRVEERTALQAPRGKQPSTDLWSAYFSRSQEAYRSLIRHYVDDGADHAAFEYAEKARAYEPLHRILDRTDVPLPFRALVQDGEPLLLDEVEWLLPAGTFLLQYSVLNDRTYVWIIGNGFSERRTLNVGELKIRSWTRALQKFADLRDTDRFMTALAAPYDALLRDPLARIHQRQRRGPVKLVIVPDRSMHGLPFAALHDGNRHLVQRYTVSVQGSATLYAYSLAQDAQLSRTAPQSVMLFADPAIDPDLELADDLPRLIAARREAARIRALYTSVAHVDPPRMDADATVAQFLRLAPENTILHIAAHGIAVPDQPSRSFLLLAPTGGDSGAIDAERLSTELHLRKTRLAVLSACSSAGGTPIGPEGLAPLVRPLLAGGVPAVVGTLWNVSDGPATEDLLVRFHEYYRDGHDADHALRLAQLDMISHAETGHRAVWNWAAFQIVGYASSPFPASSEVKRRMK